MRRADGQCSARHLRLTRRHCFKVKVVEMPERGGDAVAASITSGTAIANAHGIVYAIGSLGTDGGSMAPNHAVRKHHPFRAGRFGQANTASTRSVGLSCRCLDLHCAYGLRRKPIEAIACLGSTPTERGWASRSRAPHTTSSLARAGITTVAAEPGGRRHRIGTSPRAHRTLVRLARKPTRDRPLSPCRQTPSPAHCHPGGVRSARYAARFPTRRRAP